MGRFRKLLQIIRALPTSVVFNFKYLPFAQALKIPILLYKAHLKQMKGSVFIESDNIRFGMVRMGFDKSVIYPSTGVTWSNEGKNVFQGNCVIGNDSYIVCGCQGKIVFGKDFRATAGVKIISMCGISFGEHNLVGWGNVIIDSSFHPLYDLVRKEFRRAYGKISFGANNWLAAQCFVLPGTTTPQNCVFAARSVVGG